MYIYIHIYLYVWFIDIYIDICVCACVWFMNEIHVFARDPPWESTHFHFFPEVQVDSESDQENPVDEQTGLVGAHSTGTPAAGTPGWSHGEVFLGKTTVTGKFDFYRFFWTFNGTWTGKNMFFWSIWETPAMEMGVQWALANNKGFEPAMQKWCIEPGNIRVLRCKNGEKTSSNQTWQWKPDFLCKVWFNRWISERSQGEHMGDTISDKADHRLRVF